MGSCPVHNPGSAVNCLPELDLANDPQYTAHG